MGEQDQEVGLAVGLAKWEGGDERINPCLFTSQLKKLAWINKTTARDEAQVLREKDQLDKKMLSVSVSRKPKQ